MNSDIFYLGIVGSRTFTDYEMFKEKISQILLKLRSKYSKIVFVSGGCPKGADHFAKQYAIENSIEIIEYLADWDKYGKSAGFKRNQLIIDKSDLLVAFWDGQSKGTLHDLKLMNMKKINRTIIIKFNLKV